MFDLGTIGQFPLGIAIGVASALVPSVMRFLLVLALALLAIQAGTIYAAGGTTALATALHWLIAFAGSFLLAISGIGIGRLAVEMLLGRG